MTDIVFKIINKIQNNIKPTNKFNLFLLKFSFHLQDKLNNVAKGENV